MMLSIPKGEIVNKTCYVAPSTWGKGVFQPFNLKIKTGKPESKSGIPRMAPNDTRAAYIGGREKPSEAEVQSMTLVGGTGAMRAMMDAGGHLQGAGVRCPFLNLS